MYIDIKKIKELYILEQYLILYTSGRIRKCAELTDDIKDACEDDYLDVVRIKNNNLRFLLRDHYNNTDRWIKILDIYE